MNCLSCANDYIEHMATFTVLVKIEYFCNREVPGLGEIFVQRKFLAIRYYIFLYAYKNIHMHMYM